MRIKMWFITGPTGACVNSQNAPVWVCFVWHLKNATNLVRLPLSLKVAVLNFYQFGRGSFVGGLKMMSK